MTKKSDQQRTQEFLDLGNFIFHQYNRVSGMLAYDPEGLYQDIRDQAARICSDEIEEIRRLSEEARMQIKTDLDLMRLKCELAISQAETQAYKRIIDLQSQFMAMVIAAPEMLDTSERLEKLEADLPKELVYQPQHEDAYLAFNLAVHAAVQTMQHKVSTNLNRFTDWSKRRFGTPDLDH